MADPLATLLALRGYRLWVYQREFRGHSLFRIAKVKPHLGSHAWGFVFTGNSISQWIHMEYTIPVYSSTYHEVSWDKFVGLGRSKFNLADFENFAVPHL